ncbi:MAG: RHS domain-containing protein [Candidatus Thiodiazotropha sp. (ex Myrtea sp. 'scaly one' KF741663)]|nr:RHS domain-containing protein [Candidatus Thiodiazotropha sp. (ex Myrtea sp. 'scaly one' KF741663)]
MNHSIQRFLCGLLWLLLVVSSNIQAQSLVTYYHTDVLGSPIAATDEHGNDLWNERYQPYGERIDKDPESDENKIWYTGKPVDESTGLSYFGARYYDPVIGRFISPDPVGFTETSIHSFNKYTYSNNNPYKYVDPDGNFAITTGILLYAAFKAWDVYDAYDAVTDPNVGRGAATFAIVAAIDPSGLSGKAKKAKRVGSFINDVTKRTPASSAVNAARLKNQLSAQEIAGGHAFEKHVLQRGEFPGFIRTRKQFADHIENVMTNPSATRQLKNGRTAFWDDATGTVVIRNPKAVDGGTAFQPTLGRQYFDDILQ